MVANGIHPKRDVVAWSAGPDSTLVIERLFARKDTPGPLVVHALTVTSHNQMERRQFEGQKRAQARYLRRLESTPYHLDVTTINIDAVGTAGVVAYNPQSFVWLMAVMPYAENGDRVHFGYLKGDDIWHSMTPFVKAFEALCRLKGITASLHPPLEWSTKDEVVRELGRFGVLPKHVWTCEEPILQGEGSPVRPLFQVQGPAASVRGSSQLAPTRTPHRSHPLAQEAGALLLP